MYNNDKISSRQLRALLFMDIVGIGVFSLPQIYYGYSGVDGWISALFSGFLAVMVIPLLGFVCEQNEGRNFIQICKNVLGKAVAGFINIVYYIFFIIIGGLFLRLFSEIISLNVYDNSLWLISGVIMVVCAYSCTLSFQQRGRMGEIIMLFFIFPILLVFIIGCINGEINNVKPVMANNCLNAIKGGAWGVVFFLPLEFLSFSAHKLKGIDIKRNAVIAVVPICALLSFITLVPIIRFGIIDVKKQVFPVIEMIYSVELPGAFVERLEVVVITFLMLGMFFVIHSFLFYSNELTYQLFYVIKNKFILIFNGLLVYIISFIPCDLNECIKILFLIVKIQFISFILLLFIISIINKGGKVFEKN